MILNFQETKLSNIINKTLPVALSCGDCNECGTAPDLPVKAKPTEPGLRNSNGGDVTGASSPS